ncbi:MAG: helix-hairpin-helix domain-containing protein, partial [Proteobacteria bacterium]|nr:helix-hairpin-helix domain-containing protein [Pseudomonadota bacterium]
KAKQLYEANREDIDSIATHGFSFAKVIAQAIKKLASENTQEEIEKKKREMQQTLRKAGFSRAQATFESPLDINEASYDELIRVPGVGPKTARKIVESKVKITKYEQLHELGEWIKRAKPFIEVGGKRQSMLGEF